MVTQPQVTPAALYDQDYYLWLRTTINQLGTRNFEDVDVDHLVEELASMSRREKRKLESLLIKLFEHLLKLQDWETERERNQGHWKGEIRTFRRQISNQLEDSPSLKPYILEIFEDCYQEARLEAKDRTQLPLDTFPLTPIGSLAQVLDPDWQPEN